MKLPLDFAQGILQVRSNLAQQAAQLREMKTRRIQERILEEEKLRLEQLRIMAGAGAAADETASQERVGMARVDADREAAAARIKVEERNLENQETGIASKITDDLAQGKPVFIPTRLRGKFKADQLQGPLIAEEGTDKQVPAFEYKSIPANDGSGEMYVPIQNRIVAAQIKKEEAQARAYQELEVLRNRQAENMSIKSAQLKALRDGVPWLTPADRNRIRENWRKEQLTYAFELDMAKDDPAKRAEVIARHASDPDPRKMLGLAVEMWSQDNDINAPAQAGPDPASLQKQAEILNGGVPVVPSTSAAPEPKLPHGGLYEENVAYNPKTGALRSLVGRLAEKPWSEGEVKAIRKLYLDQEGAITREVLQSLQGYPIYDRPRKAPVTVQSSNGASQASPQAPSQTQSQAPVAQPTSAQIQELDALTDKRIRGPLPPQEEARYQELKTLLGI